MRRFHGAVAQHAHAHAEMHEADGECKAAENGTDENDNAKNTKSANVSTNMITKGF